MLGSSSAVLRKVPEQLQGQSASQYPPQIRALFFGAPSTRNSLTLREFSRVSLILGKLNKTYGSRLWRVSKAKQTLLRSLVPHWALHTWIPCCLQEAGLHTWYWNAPFPRMLPPRGVLRPPACRNHLKYRNLGGFKCCFILTNTVKINIKSGHAQSFLLIYNTKGCLKSFVFTNVP